PDADPPAARLGEALDLAGVDTDLTAARPLAPRLRICGARRRRRLGGSPGDLLEPGRLAAHTAVPPTVIPRMRTCPWPVPTGAVWPALPQKPVFISKSLPTASIRSSACRQLPIRVAPRQGRVTLPPSIR